MAYVTVTIEGGLFPPDLLDRIAAGEVDGQRPADFGLDGTKRLSEETQSAFSDARARWDAFQRRLHRAPDRATTLTREDWMVPFLELLGFDDLALQRASAEAGGETFFISHRAGDDPAAPPVHIVSCNDDLDRRGPTGRRSPHALVQEYLNRSDAVWGLVTNGRQLRLLRNSTRFARPTYVQFDLEGLIQSNLYGEFVLLYRLLHRSRFPRDAASVAGSWLERYYQQGIDEGGRAREKLREGVEEALKTLGTALLEHPGNEALRQRVAEGTLDAAAYYRQLLRLIYRLLFLLVAEERRLLLPPDSPNPDAFRVYERYYSVSALRERSERYFAGDRHSDLWQGLVATFRLFREDGLARRVGLRALNGELFGPHACPDVENASCANEALLTAVRHLSTFTDDGGGRRRRRAAGVRRRVNYAALDVEELGSVYESLLEYQPQITLAPPGFVLDPEGSERRSTGSYYTPPELVRELIDHALVPVMEEKLRAAKTRDEKEQALLSLRVCDPASGSGHFLLAAARRIGAELARVRTGEEEPSPAARREATRDVIRSCVYAVDKNPLAVDLCKVALWIEANDAGKPLTFLDHHVKCGDSLVGVLDPAVLRDGIPDAAFDRPAGQPKTIGRELKIRNRRERAVHASQRYLPLEDHLDELAAGFEELDRMPDDSPQAVVEKERKFRELTARKDALDDRMACHLWTAPFFLDLASTGDGTPTTATLRRFLQNPGAFDGRVAGIVQKEAGDRRFFHWPLEFPDVFVNGGFDVALSNPPFMGGLKISDGLGDEYRRYLTTVFAPAGGTCDLCAYFYRRAFDILRPGGHLGMVATNTIGQGDTREGGLAVIVRNGGAITFAHRFIKWPGAASVEVNLLTIRRGPWRGECLLDGEAVPSISSRLDDEPEQQPERLPENEGKAFQGSIVLGMGFVLEPEEAKALMARNPRNRDCLFPYLNGEDLNSDPEQQPRRWVINFFDWPLEKAREYPRLLEIVEAKVKPERERLRDDVSIQAKRKQFWWQYGSPATQLYAAIAPLRRVLVIARITEHFGLVFVPKGWVYNEKTIVFAFDDDYHFTVLQSTIHELWARKYSSTLESRFNYAPTDCFDTFPFPQAPSAQDREWAARVGGEYHERRRQVMLARNLGLTRTYNLFHNPDCHDEDIVRLRELHAEMDRAILACYGWRDIDPGHGFHRNERGQTRYTISPDARREILRRLLDLNLRIAGEQGGRPPAEGPRFARGVAS